MNERVERPSQGILSVKGLDAAKFLQGQLTCNIDEINETFRLAAHCNPKGRIISLFQITSRDNSYFLIMPYDLLPIALEALKKYAVFFKVTLEEVSHPDPSLLDPRTEKERCYQNILAGIPTIYAETSEKFLPHELNLPALNAVSFNKGCYTGQEIIARMHYRGKLKTRLISLEHSCKTPPVRGEDISLNEKTTGKVVDFCLVGDNTYALLLVS